MAKNKYTHKNKNNNNHQPETGLAVRSKTSHHASHALKTKSSNSITSYLENYDKSIYQDLLKDWYRTQFKHNQDDYWSWVVEFFFKF